MFILKEKNSATFPPSSPQWSVYRYCYNST